MTDTQPLVEAVDKPPGGAEKTRRRRSSASDLSNWRQFIGKNPSAEKYEKLDDDDHSERKKSMVGLFGMFRYADRIDFLLLFIGTFAAILEGICFTAHVLLFGRLTGNSATQASIDQCPHHLHKNSTIIANTSNKCPLGIELNSYNYDRFYRLCSASINSARSIVALRAEFRADTMNKIYFLFMSTKIITILISRKTLAVSYIYIVIGAIEFVCLFVSFYMFDLAAKRQAWRMRVRLFQAIIQRSVPYFDTKPSGQLNDKLFDNIDKFITGCGLQLGIVVAVLVGVCGSITIALIVQWQLTLIMICFVPVIIIIVNLLGKLTGGVTESELDSYSKAGRIVQEVFSSLRTVLALNGAQFEKKRYERALRGTHWSSVRKGAVFGLFAGWMMFIFYILYAVGFIAGSFLMHLEGRVKLSASDVVVVVLTFAQSIILIGFIGIFFQSVAEAQGAITPVFRLIDEAQEADTNEPQVWADTDNALVDVGGDIQFENVNFSYPAREDASVLRELTLVARASETTALVGSSGCGKSTCVSLLLRFYEPSSGQVTINGRSIANENIKRLRENIGVVSQEPILFGTSIYENIRYGKQNATRAEIEEAARQANAHNFIMMLPNKYETQVGERGIQLSGGEKQRIALARALVKQPALLLLDEATSALDNASEKIVQEALDRACKGRTTIVIAHRLSTIRNADRIYVLDRGQVIEQGNHETLMAQDEGRYRGMVNRQQLDTMDDDQDIPMTRAQVEEEDEKQMFERQRLLSDSQGVHVDEKSSSSSHQEHPFLRLMRMNSPEWLMILIGCIVCIACGATQPVFAILLTRIINALEDCTYGERLRHVMIISLTFLMLGLGLFALRFLQFVAFAISGSKLTQRVRAKAFGCLLRQEVAYFDRPENSSGAVCARLSADALALQEMTGTRLGLVVETCAMFGFGLILGFWFSWQLTLIVVIAIAILMVLARLELRSQVNISDSNRVTFGQASSLAVEVIQNIRTVKQLTLEKEVCRQYSELVHETFRRDRLPTFMSALVTTTFWAMNPILLGILYWRALILVEHKELDMRDIVMVFAFVTFAMQGMQVAMSMTRQIAASYSAARTFFILFDRTPTIDNGSTEGQELTDFRGEIEFDQVKFAYPARPAVRILNKLQLTIKPGQRVALVGASGCGKSTVIQLLERFYDVSQGQLRLDGVDIQSLNIHWVRSRLGLVSQEPVLFDMTIAENIAYGKEDTSLEEIMDVASKANIHQFIQQLPQGYKTSTGTKGSQLSGGEKQRIAIARALLRRPKVLLLDEATSAMDSYNEQVVQQALEQAQLEDPSRTSLIIAHRLSTIRSCDLICVLEKGHIVESGTHPELMQRHGIYYQMVARNSS